jgi:phenylalanyl-tRNA synthetase alpha chain
MDALFMPQFHSARDIHQAYYIKDPAYCKLDEKIVEKVKKAHENGFETGSKGWQYKFDGKRTHRNLLRTQGTACSARMLASQNLKIPGKYFGITRCFRYDVIDATHNCDFYQTEGIVVEQGLNLKHLFGLLKMFAKEFAETDEVKLVPAYFPFTEPSVELFAKHPKLGWIELGGAGIFRPELVKPLTGKEVPVIAWGLGIDRIAMFKLGIKDIRQLFSHDLKFLRTTKLV